MGIAKIFNRQLIKAIYDEMSRTRKESISFDVKNEKCPYVTNQNNNFKYKIDTLYLPNIGREKWFIELDVYNSYDNQHYNIIIDENDWDVAILKDIYKRLIK